MLTESMMNWRGCFEMTELTGAWHVERTVPSSCVGVLTLTGNCPGSTCQGTEGGREVGATPTKTNKTSKVVTISGVSTSFTF